MSKATVLRVIFMFCLLLNYNSRAGVIKTSVLIIGGGASGTAAGIQASRMGVPTLIVEQTEWLGGMLTSAGVSAIDGNHEMPSGIWGEFRQKLYNYYGGSDSVATGWVSNTLFEPSVGNKILKQMASNKNLNILYHTRWLSVSRKNRHWYVWVNRNNKRQLIEAEVLIDATELGDIMAALKIPYRIGMDSRTETGEPYAPTVANSIVQDLTYVITLKDYGKKADKTIAKPLGYDAKEFECACNVADVTVTQKATMNCLQMLNYGRLPNNKYMINWPRCGNDFYLNDIGMSPASQAKALKNAKLHSLKFIYYLQTALGFKNLGLADDEYPTVDRLPMIPYYREARRMRGLVTLTVNYLEKPYEQRSPLYRTGIAVGNYPIDHHHAKYPAAPKIDFAHIKVPAYNIPLGALIAPGDNNFITAEKSISVSNIVNGTTRLQPVVLQIGQAAGALAATAVLTNTNVSKVSVRNVQRVLLKYKAYIMPFEDVKPADSAFCAIQRIGATGILKGFGISSGWANKMLFYPSNKLTRQALLEGLSTYYPQFKHLSGTDTAFVTLQFLGDVLNRIDATISYAQISRNWRNLSLPDEPSGDNEPNRQTIAVLLDHYLHPFDLPVDFSGEITSQPANYNSK